MVKELEQLSKKSEHAIKFLAAEFGFVEELENELAQAEREEPAGAAKKAKQMLRTYRWVARSEYRSARDEDAILDLLGELEKILPKNERENAETYRKQLKIANDILKKATSFYTGELKKDISDVEKDEALIAQLEKDPKHARADQLRAKLQADFTTLKKALAKLKEWTSTNTTLVESIERWNEHLQQLAA